MLRAEMQKINSLRAGRSICCRTVASQRRVKVKVKSRVIRVGESKDAQLLPVVRRRERDALWRPWKGPLGRFAYWELAAVRELTGGFSWPLQSY